jgi:hypothetical protein
LLEDLDLGMSQVGGILGKTAMLLGSHRNVFMSVFSALALLAIVMRGVIPTGYMIKAPESEGAFIEIELCHGDGSPASKLRIDLGSTENEDDGAPTGEPGDASKAPCAFAAITSFIPEANFAAFTPPPVVDAQRRVPVSLRPGRGLASPPPPATGPPTFI